MTVGTGIFLSALILGTVALYIATKDRWKWKRIVIWTFAGIVTIAAVGGAWVYYAQERPKPPIKETAFWGIPLGATRSDVTFHKGKPLSDTDKDAWVYEASSSDKNARYIVHFWDGKADLIAYHGSSLYAPNIQLIGGYDNTASIKAKFGEPSLISTSKDETQRVISYDRYNVFFNLEKDKVLALGVFDGTRRPGVRFKEEAGDSPHADTEAKKAPKPAR